MRDAIKLVDVTVSFFNQPVLRNITASFPANRVSVLVGRSGSGKTTLLRTINRLNEELPGCATTGRVLVDFGQGLQDIYDHRNKGKEGLSLPELRLRLGMLFQTPNCLPVSVYRNIAMPLALVAGTPSTEVAERVQAALESVGLWEELHARLHEPANWLSGGQQQRLCLARLIALQPKVLLLDEPTASLDVHAANEIESLLHDLSSQYTVIMVSHSLRQARHMGDRVLVCDSGSIIGTIEDKSDMREDTLAELMNS